MALRPIEEAYRAWGGEPDEHLDPDSADAARLAAVARHPATPMDLLARLVTYVPAAVVANPALPALLPRETGWVLGLDRDALETLFVHNEYMAPAAQQALIATLIEHPDLEARRYLALVPGVPFAILERLACEDDEWTLRLVRDALGNRDVPPETLFRLATSPDVGLRTWAQSREIALAKDPSTSAAWLAQLGTSPDEWRRWDVARNPGTPAEILAALATEEDDKVREAAQRHPAMPGDILELIELAELSTWFPGAEPSDEDDDEELPTLSPDQRAQLLVGGPYLRILYGQLRVHTPDDLRALANHDDRFVRQGVAENPNTAADVLERLAKRGL